MVVIKRNQCLPGLWNGSILISSNLRVEPELRTTVILTQFPPGRNREIFLFRCLYIAYFFNIVAVRQNPNPPHFHSEPRPTSFPFKLSMITGSSNDLNFSVQINKVSTIFHVRGTVIGHSNEDEPLTFVISI